MVSPLKSCRGDLCCSAGLPGMEVAARTWVCTSVGVEEGRLGGGANTCALKRHLGTLENEGQFTSRVSGFYHCWGKNSIYSISVSLKVVSLKVTS